MKVQIENEFYLVPVQSTFLELKKSIYNDFDIIVSHFRVMNANVSDKLNPNEFYDIIGVEDKNEYESYGEDNKYKRCVNCRKTLIKSTLKCSHTSKCKNQMSIKDKSQTLSEFASFVPDLEVGRQESIAENSFGNVSSINTHRLNSFLSSFQALMTKEEYLRKELSSNQFDFDLKSIVSLPSSSKIDKSNERLKTQ
jgi:hypothetical protein